MSTPPDTVRRFYEARAASFSEPFRVIGPGEELSELPDPNEDVAVPPAVLEACGFYFLNILKPDRGSVYTFRADAADTPTYGVLATCDGSDRWLEVYGAAGELLGAARVDSGFVLWRDRDSVRRKVWEGELEPELLAARQRRARGGARA